SWTVARSAPSQPPSSKERNRGPVSARSRPGLHQSPTLTHHLDTGCAPVAIIGFDIDARERHIGHRWNKPTLRHPGDKAAQRFFFFHSDDAVIVTAHTRIA